ncbi:MAG: DoxX family protein [Paraglaciecola sp.]|nr:DoxX family protein [Paraglaciecola sp.]NCT49058.1 DoxX family protein [Paraglaciecola sp.]
MTAVFFLAHAVVRIVNDTIPQFAEFMGNLGFPAPVIVVWLITLLEIVGGIALMVGRYTRPVVISFMAIVVGGIALIHWRFGWFVGEHGTGGSEYSVCLLLCLLVIAAADKEGIYQKSA